MSPEVIAYLQRSVTALTSETSMKDQVKILKVISQLTAKAASDIELAIELERNTHA
jgi:hypothetical protein